MQRLLASREAELNGGAKSIGWKIGINVPAAQAHFGLKGPVVGYLTDRTVIPGGRPIDVSAWLHPALEVELAIRVGNNADVAGLSGAVELVDLNLPFDDITLILEGNIFHRGVIFGPETRDLELDELTGIVTVAGKAVVSGTLTEHPVTTVEYVRAYLA